MSFENIFDHNIKKYDEWYETHKFAYLSELKALKKVVPQNKTGLEIGVGTGRFAGPLKIAAGIDPSPGMLVIARKRGIDVYEGFGENLPFTDGSFDYAAIIITLCFVNDPIQVLKEAWRVLKENGELIVGFVDKNSFLGKFYQDKKSPFYAKAKFFDVEEVAEMLKHGGFYRNAYYQTLSVFPEELKVVERPKKGFGRGGFVIIHSNKRERT
jgi:ubiquinone/menaquinone biosynthesis C-methylase UbiE